MPNSVDFKHHRYKHTGKRHSVTNLLFDFVQFPLDKLQRSFSFWRHLYRVLWSTIHVLAAHHLASQLTLLFYWSLGNRVPLQFFDCMSISVKVISYIFYCLQKLIQNTCMCFYIFIITFILDTFRNTLACVGPDLLAFGNNYRHLLDWRIDLQKTKKEVLKSSVLTTK